MFIVYMEWCGDYVKDVESFFTEKEALDYCNSHNWEILYDGVWFDLNIGG